MRNIALLILSLFFSSQALAGLVITNVKDVGSHYELLTFEKSINPQNIMVVYTKLDKNCHFLRDKKQNNQPVVDFYWLMDHTKYKPVAGAIVNGTMGIAGIRDRMKVVAGKGDIDTFAIVLKDLEDVRTDIQDPRMIVQATKTDKGCETQSVITLGPSSQNKQIWLDSIYSDAEKTGMFSVKLNAIALKGEDISTGKHVAATYKGK